MQCKLPCWKKPFADNFQTAAQMQTNCTIGEPPLVRAFGQQFPVKFFLDVSNQPQTDTAVSIQHSVKKDPASVRF